MQARKQEIENQIQSLTYPLTYSQTIKLDQLKKELNKINYILKQEKTKNE